MRGLEAAQYKTSFQCGYRVLADEGLLALWKGATPRLSRVIFSSGLQFTFYEQVCSSFQFFTQHTSAHQQILKVLNSVFPEDNDKPKAAAHVGTKPVEAAKPAAATPSPAVDQKADAHKADAKKDA